MLSHLVRPMVRTQLRLLANSHTTRTTLINTISEWLGFLGVEAQVTYLDAAANQIHVSLRVEKPEACDPEDWQQIVQHLDRTRTWEQAGQPVTAMTPQQQSKLQRLLAHLLQVGNPPEQALPWEVLQPQLRSLGFDEEMLLGIRAALRVPQSLDHLLEGLDPDVAAIALPKAVSIALLDRQVNPHEDRALTALLEAMK